MIDLHFFSTDTWSLSKTYMLMVLGRYIFDVYYRYPWRYLDYDAYDDENAHLSFTLNQFTFIFLWCDYSCDFLFLFLFVLPFNLFNNNGKNNHLVKEHIKKYRRRDMKWSFRPPYFLPWTVNPCHSQCWHEHHKVEWNAYLHIGWKWDWPTDHKARTTWIWVWR